MPMKNADHDFMKIISRRVLARIAQERAKDQTYESIAEKCRTVKNHIYDLHKGKKRLTLNMAFRIWEGLGGQLSELLIDVGPEPFWDQLLVMDKEEREVILQLIDLLARKDAPGIQPLKNLIKNLHEEIIGKNPPVNTPK